MTNKIINLFGNDHNPSPEKVPYSKLLEQLVAEFESEFKDFEYIEDIFEFAIEAWNVANLQADLPDEIRKAKQDIDASDVNFDLFNNLVAYKIKHFKQHTNFIVDFEIEEKPNEKVLNVVSQPKEVFLENYFNEMEEFDELEDTEENYIDRKAIVIKPLQPLIDWAANLPDQELLPDLEDTFINSYLIDVDTDDAEKWLKKKFDKLFQLELEDWCENKKLWPQKRNYKMFNQWFRVEISEFVYDLEKRKVSKGI